MASKFKDALDYLSGYYRYKLRSESNAARPMWFSGFSRYPDPKSGELPVPKSTAELVDVFDPKPDDNLAFAAYTKSKDPNDKSVTSRYAHAARVRLRVMASLRQTVGRQWLGADANVRTSADSHRYEYDRKVAALGLSNILRDNFKEPV